MSPFGWIKVLLFTELLSLSFDCLSICSRCDVLWIARIKMSHWLASNLDRWHVDRPNCWMVERFICTARSLVNTHTGVLSTVMGNAQLVTGSASKETGILTWSESSQVVHLLWIIGNRYVVQPSIECGWFCWQKEWMSSFGVLHDAVRIVLSSSLHDGCKNST